VLGEQATPDLRALGPLEMLDGALLAVRRGGPSRLLRAWAGAGPLALCAVSIYYLERVEGVRSLRPLFAVLFVLCFWLRAILLCQVARGYALAIRPTLPVSPRLARPVDVACTASVFGLGLWVWLLPIAGICALMPLAVAALLPFLALRGAVAPSWLTRAACAPERGFAAFGQAFEDTAGMSGVFMIVELATLFGAIGLFANLYALTSFGLLLAHSLLGVDVAFVSSFLSPDNTLVLLVLAAATLIALEPLRAAISAQAFVDARSRRDGADLHAAIDLAIAQHAQRGRRGGDSQPPIAAALLLLAGSLLMAMPARAQAPPAAGSSIEEAAAQPSGPASDAADGQVRERLTRILTAREFRDFAEQDSSSVHDLLEKLFKWLDGLGDDLDDQPSRASFKLPPISPWVLMGLAVIALCSIAAYVSAARKRSETPSGGPAEPVELIASRQPGSLLDEAARLAAQGDARGALRALYLATLSALDRARLIDYEPSKTNWQYLRSLPRGALSQDFASFTRIFDHKWYGQEAATHGDYEECRRLADRICAAGAA
jgi:hypothetical protein